MGQERPSKMTVDVHSLMQDTNDVDPDIGQPIKDNMRSGGIFEIARPDLIAGPPQARVGRKGCHRRLDPANISFSVRVTPSDGRIVPNLRHIGMRAS
jgi:hypothetical protein